MSLLNQFLVSICIIELLALLYFYHSTLITFIFENIFSSSNFCIFWHKNSTTHYSEWTYLTSHIMWQSKIPLEGICPHSLAPIRYRKESYLISFSLSLIYHWFIWITNNIWDRVIFMDSWFWSLNFLKFMINLKVSHFIRNFIQGI